MGVERKGRHDGGETRGKGRRGRQDRRVGMTEWRVKRQETEGGDGGQRGGKSEREHEKASAKGEDEKKRKGKKKYTRKTL